MKIISSKSNQYIKLIRQLRQRKEREKSGKFYQLKGLWIALSNVQDPGNLGTIIRSLDGARGKGLILLGNSTDADHQTSIRSSTEVGYSLTNEKENLKEFREWKSKESVPFIGTVCREAINYRKYNYPQV